MKLVFDCTTLASWQGRYTGIPRAVSEIGRHLRAYIPCTELAVLECESVTWRSFMLDSNIVGDVIAVNAGDLVFTAGANWDYPKHAAALSACAAQGVKLGAFFHDTIPITHPHTYGPGFGAIYKSWLTQALREIECAYANSKSSARDVSAFAQSLKIPIGEVGILRLGDNIHKEGGTVSEAVAKLTERPIVLTVGTLEARKNHITLLNTWRYLVGDVGFEPPHLVIVGRPGWNDAMLAFQVDNDPLLHGRVTILNDLSDGDLSHLYQNTLFTVYPSLYEGWGLPIAESLSFGKVCVASNTSSMVEIAPGIVRHAHPLMVNEWAKQIRELSENPDVLAAEEARIAAEYCRSTWDQSAAQLARGLIAQYPSLGK